MEWGYRIKDHLQNRTNRGISLSKLKRSSPLSWGRLNLTKGFERLELTRKCLSKNSDWLIVFRCSDGVYTPKNEKIFQMENGYYLLYYHNPEWWRMIALYMRFLVPLGVLIYLIRKNPFYQTYPAALPMMFIAAIWVFISMIKYSKVTNMLVHQVHMDPTGTELTFIYKNQFFRRFRNDKPEQSILISNLVDPPQGENY